MVPILLNALTSNLALLGNPILAPCSELVTSLFWNLALTSLWHSKTPRVLWESLDVQQVWKLPWIFLRFFWKICKIWKSFAFFQRFFQRNMTFTKHDYCFFFLELLSNTPNPVCVFVWGSWALGFRFLISCDGENMIIQHSTLSIQQFSLAPWMQLWNGKNYCFSRWTYSFTQALLKYGNGGCIKGIKWRWENRKFSLGCVFFPQLFHCCLCVWCASFFF